MAVAAHSLHQPKNNLPLQPRKLRSLSTQHSSQAKRAAMEEEHPPLVHCDDSDGEDYHPSDSESTAIPTPTHESLTFLSPAQFHGHGDLKGAQPAHLTKKRAASAGAIVATSTPKSALATSVSRLPTPSPILSKPPKVVGEDVGITRPSRRQHGARFRKCHYCGVEQTPMWRRGPFGPGTLCNACGVKWKDGRILQNDSKGNLPVVEPATKKTRLTSKRSTNKRSRVPLSPATSRTSVVPGMHTLSPADYIAAMIQVVDKLQGQCELDGPAILTRLENVKESAQRGQYTIPSLTQPALPLAFTEEVRQALQSLDSDARAARLASLTALIHGQESHLSTTLAELVQKHIGTRHSTRRRKPSARYASTSSFDEDESDDGEDKENGGDARLSGVMLEEKIQHVKDSIQVLQVRLHQLEMQRDRTTSQKSIDPLRQPTSSFTKLPPSPPTPTARVKTERSADLPTPTSQPLGTTLHTSPHSPLTVAEKQHLTFSIPPPRSPSQTSRSNHPTIPPVTSLS